MSGIVERHPCAAYVLVSTLLTSTVYVLIMYIMFRYLDARVELRSLDFKRVKD